MKELYPNYNRSEKLNCKLNDEQIKEIRMKRKMGIKLIALANEYNVNISTIKYWLSEKIRQKQITLATERYKKNYNKVNVHQWKKNYIKRKKILQPEIRNYFNRYHFLYKYRNNRSEIIAKLKEKIDLLSA